MAYPKVYELKWDGVEYCCNTIAENIKGMDFKPVGILAITRGGLVPAGILSHLLDVRMIETIGFRSYSDDRQQRPPEIFKVPSIRGVNWLILDDIVDTGKTMKHVHDMFPKSTLAALVAKGRLLVDVVGRVVNPDTWVKFPWEVN